MNVAIWAGIGIVVIGLVAILLSGRKKKWYEVYRADGDVRLMYRTWSQRMWSGDKYIKFMGDNGHEFTFPSNGHWLLAYELIPDEQVETVRGELLRMREAQAKEKD